MAFVDEITITASAGRGGDGVVRWRHEKFIDRGGPSGGDGGNGGDVYIVGARDVHLLSKYKTKKEFKAENGADGGKKNLEGENGADVEIMLPVGSVVTNTETQKSYRLNSEGEKHLILKGGRGGFGNAHFKSATNTTPKEWTPGKPGEKGEFYIEVELTADIGLIGLPNAGKTSLLNALTAAHGKVGDYPFTTLEPNLGECYGRIIADIPGLIEGAGSGKGLGHKFLRHVRRTKTLAHLISLENEKPLEAYKSVRKELSMYDEKLSEKDEVVILTKRDTVSEEDVAKTVALFKKEGLNVESISVLNDADVKNIREKLLSLVE